LVVDDNETNRTLIAELTEGWGASAATAPTAAGAVEALTAASQNGEPFDIVVVDSHMPTQDGFVLVERMQSEDRMGDARTIMMLTCDRLHEDALRCRQLGIQGYLTKPIMPSRLCAALLDAVRGEPMPQVELTSPQVLVESSRPMRILLAEDSALNQKVAVGLLERCGHRVDVAENGRAALRLLEQQSFDLMLLDVQMPEMDGLETVAAIRRDERGTNRHLPIIAMTAHALKGDRERCLEAGMDGYVAKPLRAEALFAAIAEIGGHETGPQTIGAVPLDTAAPADENTNTVVDWAAASKAVGGNQQLLCEVVEVFLEECPQLVVLLQEAVKRQDWETWTRAAHTIKGTIRHFGAWRAVAHATELERMGRDREAAGAPERFAMLQQEVDRVLKSLSSYLEQNAVS
jgi:CheY-like chemotaxis protein